MDEMEHANRDILVSGDILVCCIWNGTFHTPSPTKVLCIRMESRDRPGTAIDRMNF